MDNMTVRQRMEQAARHERIIAMARDHGVNPPSGLSRPDKIVFIENICSANEQLFYEVSKDYMTIGVGTIEIIEDNFGHLWGQDLNINQLDEEHLEWRAIWNPARSAILDSVNRKIRILQGKLFFGERNG